MAEPSRNASDKENASRVSTQAKSIEAIANESRDEKQ
jgi:hypothetical protein